MTAPVGIADLSEAALVADIVRLFRRRWPVTAFALEVRSHGRCRTDACFLVRDDAGGPLRLVGVEAKLADGTRAVAQAAMNRYAVDLSYVAMPTARLSPALLEQAARHGVGVLAVGKTAVDVALPPAPNIPDPVLRAKVADQLDSVRPRGREQVGLLAFARQEGGPVSWGAA
jgi:hypothetical protein